MVSYRDHCRNSTICDLRRLHRCSKKRPAWIILSILCLVVIIVTLVPVILHLQDKHTSKNPPSMQPTAASATTTTTNSLWASLSTSIGTSTHQQSIAVGVKTVTFLSAKEGTSSGFTAFVTQKIVQTLRTPEISESTGIFYTVEISASLQARTSISFTTAVLTSTITQASSALTPPIAGISGTLPPASHFVTTLMTETSLQGASTLDVTFLSIPTALSGNKLKRKGVLAPIDIAISDSAKPPRAIVSPNR